MCQKEQNIRGWDYCCELEVPGLSETETFTDTWNKLKAECFEEKDDHIPFGITNGASIYGVDSVLCRLKTIKQ